MTQNWQPRPAAEAPAQPWGGYLPPGYEPVELVPRPPRPAAVNLALLLTIAGVIVAAAEFALSALITWQHRDQILASSARQLQDESTKQMVIVVGIVASGLLTFLLPAAGALVCAALAHRGKNAARIVLAVLMLVFALAALCQAGLGGVAGSQGAGAAWISFSLIGLRLTETVLAVTIGVLVLVPASNQYFRPGPGRRFDPSRSPVPSSYDRP
jgi:hypothetical protein